MILKYFDTANISPLVEELFYLKFSNEVLPFQSTVLPIGLCTITCVFTKGQSVIYKDKKTSIYSLTVTGQFFQSYEFLVQEPGQSYGIVFHPTALHKITQLNIHKIKNKHLPLNEFSPKLFQLLNPIFAENEVNMDKLTKTVIETILQIPITTSKTITQIDNLIAIIYKKEAMLNTYELLDHVDFSQKTLETQFKKIVGLTPGKYIRLHRFLKLMRKYEGKEIDIKDLIYMYNYYDHSHFAKDFRYFMKQSPKEYFNTDHPFLNEYLNK